MKNQINSIKSSFSRFIYKKMYSDNYTVTKNVQLVITDNVNHINKRALGIKLSNKSEVGHYCIVTAETPVRKIDSNINKKALKISLTNPKSLTNKVR
jgi:hypothetical protein